MSTQTLASDYLEDLADQLEDQLDGFAEVDLNNSMLSIDLADSTPVSGEFLINYHGPTSQLWLSSPISGAHHFEYKDNDWISTRAPETILEILAKELRQATNREVVIKIDA